MISKESQVRMKSGEIVSIAEYIYREWGDGMADIADEALLSLVRHQVATGASFSDLLPYYQRFLPDAQKIAFESIGVNLTELFRRVHESIVKRVVS